MVHTASGDDTEDSAANDDRAISKEPSEDGEVDKDSPPNARIKPLEEVPPLPQETAPPLPDATPPAKDDGWDALWDETAQAFYFYNRFTQLSQWTNPRVPEPTEQPGPPGVGNHDRMAGPPPGTISAAPAQPNAAENKVGYTGYNPTIHGDYDPTAAYAQEQPNGSFDPADPSTQATDDPENPYAATGTFNRFTGKWQPHTINPEVHNDENKSRRQMSAFFDVDAAANSHNGKSLKAERAGKKLSKQELKAFKEKRKERKEEKRRAWLRD